MIRLISLGVHYVHPEGIVIHRPGGAGSYSFVFFKSASEVLLNGKRVPLKANTWILFRPDTPQYYKEKAPPFVNDWFHCEGEDLPAFLEEIRFPLDQPLPIADPERISRALLDLLTVREDGGALKERIVDAELRAFLLRLCTGQNRVVELLPESGRYEREFLSLRGELYGTPQKGQTLEKMAERVNLSPAYFQHVYTKIFGISFGRDRILGRLSHAKYLLENSSLPMKEVAERSGYICEVHFMRQFKKFVGTTPGRYRAESRRQEP